MIFTDMDDHTVSNRSNRIKSGKLALTSKRAFLKEYDYIKSGFFEISKILKKKFNIDFKAQWAAGYGWSGARSGRRLL